MKQFLYLCAFVGMILTLPYQASATGLSNNASLSGWIWSSTIGWISMSCDNTTSCAGSPGGIDYGVEITPTGDLAGYAWSSNIGWIRFDGLSQFPAGLSTVAASARTTGSYPNLTLDGWARACSGTVSGTCATMDSRTDGWDGWIALSGQSDNGSSYGVTFDAEGATANSYSWGNEVIGWISWSGTADDGTPYGAVFTDIDISAFSASPGTLDNTTGIYDSISMLTAVTGIPDGETVNYEITVDGVPTTITGTVSSDGTFSSVIPAVPFTAETATIAVDTPFPGVVEELDEINERTVNLNLATPTAQMVLEVVDDTDVIQIGDSIEFDWSIVAPFPVTCELRGPGLSESVTVAGVPGVPAGRGSLPTAISPGADPRFTATDVQSSGTYVMRCDDDEVSVSVEVVPQVQEI